MNNLYVPSLVVASLCSELLLGERGADCLAKTWQSKSFLAMTHPFLTVNELCLFLSLLSLLEAGLTNELQWG